MSLYKVISPYLFTLEPERAHNLTAWALKNIAPLPLVQDYLAGRYCVVDEALATEVCGLKFYNPVGLAAGFDKNATMVKGLSALGFGFLELGTITQVPQEGNPRPRIFRYPDQRSIQNAMGFNNHGSLQVAKRLKKLYPYSIPLGVNIGKNKAIAQSDSLQNYEVALLDLLEVGDYYVFNLSSPNTPNLRDLQNVSFVGELFTMARQHTAKPLFLKIAPDMDTDEMLKVVEKAIKAGASGIIATNTTIDYSVLEGARESGGISGAALKEKSKEVFAILSQAFFGKTALISVGGIDSAQEAYERLKLGASLVQVYSGMIFEGPGLCHKINSGLAQLLRQEGFSSLQEVIGSQRGAPKATRGRKKTIATGEIKEVAAKPTKRATAKKLDSEKSKVSESGALESKLSESKATKASTRGRKPKASSPKDSNLEVKDTGSTKATKSTTKAATKPKTSAKPKKAAEAKAAEPKATKPKAPRAKKPTAALGAKADSAIQATPSKEATPSNQVGQEAAISTQATLLDTESKPNTQS